MPDSFQADSFQPDEKKTSFLGGIKKTADDFILRHLDELAQKKSGILNPDPSQNPLVDKPLLPEMNRFGSASGMMPRAVQGIYNQVVRPFSSPLGMLGMAVDPEKIGGLPEPAKPPKKPLALPPAPPEIANPPKFIAGPTGQVAASPVAPNVSARLANMGVEGHPQTGGIGTAMNPAEVAEQNRLRNLSFTQAQQNPGASIDIERQPPAMPPVSGDTRGGFTEQTRAGTGESLADVLARKKAAKEAAIQESIAKVEGKAAKAKAKVTKADETVATVESAASQPGDVEPLPYPLNVVPNAVRPRAAQAEVLGMTGLGHVEPPVKPISPEPPVERVPEPPLIDETARPEYLNTEAVKPGETLLPSAAKNQPKPPDLSRPMAQPGARKFGKYPKKAAGTMGPVGPIVDAEILPKSATKPIPPKRPLKQVVQDWANGRKAANQYGRNAAKDFADLTDPELINKYQAGDRTGRLSEVEQHLEALRQNEVAAGVLQEDANKANYLRQYWEDSPEKVDQIFGGLIAKTPGFAKESVFQSYKQGIAAGLIPKFTTLPEILEARTAESVRAIKNKQFYDYLQSSGKVKPKVTIPDTQDIDKIGRMFKDPNDAESKELIRYISNYLGDSAPPLKRVADATSLTKNINLGGGVPGTKYNIHGWNTAKSDSKLRGFFNGIKEFVTDPTGSKAETFVNSKESKARIAKLMEYGYQYHPVEDVGHAVSQPFGAAVGHIIEKGQNIFEKPLFERSLPAMKLKGANYAFDKLRAAGMEEEQAYRQAAKIANEFYGGMDKSIRNKSTQDTLRIVALAPDWLESRVRLAASDWKGAAKTITGKGTAADKMHAKSLARGGVMAGLGMVGSAYGAGKSDKPQDITNVPIGTDAKGKQRLIDVLGTADEAMRLPIQLPLRAMQGDPMAFLKMYGENKMSQPAKSLMHIGQQRDEFGRPFSGKNISGGQSFRNNLYEGSRPFMYQGVQGFIDYINDRSSAEEAASQGAEFPLKYETKPKTKSGLGNLSRLGSFK